MDVRLCGSMCLRICTAITVLSMGVACREPMLGLQRGRSIDCLIRPGGMVCYASWAWSFNSFRFNNRSMGVARSEVPSSIHGHGPVSYFSMGEARRALTLVVVHVTVNVCFGELACT